MTTYLMWNGKLEEESSCSQLQIQKKFPLNASYECRDFYTKLTTFGLENCIFATEGSLIFVRIYSLEVYLKIIY